MGLRFRPQGLRFRPVGLRSRPQGLRFRPVGLRFRPQGLHFIPQGLRSSVIVLDTSLYQFWQHTLEQIIIIEFDCFHSLTLNYIITAVYVYTFP